MERNDTILIVVKDVIYEKILTRFLSRTQHPIEVVNSGKIALETLKLRHNNFMVILIEMNMPKKNGSTLTRMIRQYEQENKLIEIPIIALCIHYNSEYLEAGCNVVLSRPISVNQVLETIKKLTAGG
eukprot:Phypoly_transcript_23015.p1 GENE.Phypoly_transcript_23015~~Phypoly_transcript_23015.p1  ORF type:complete len:127 (+),score=16.86 Phypoly_transcript_23015:28-408(+)